MLLKIPRRYNGNRYPFSIRDLGVVMALVVRCLHEIVQHDEARYHISVVHMAACVNLFRNINSTQGLMDDLLAMRVNYSRK